MSKVNKKEKLVDNSWIIRIIFLSFFISIIFTFVSETAIPNVNLFIGILLTFIFVFIGILFDMVGISVASADETPFHSMASKKVKGSKMAIKLKKNADRVSSFCNDVVGDICGIVSGSTGVVISIKIVESTGFNSFFVSLFIMGIISSLTIGGKAFLKSFAIKKSNKILHGFAKILSVFVKE